MSGMALSVGPGILGFQVAPPHPVTRKCQGTYAQIFGTTALDIGAYLQKWNKELYVYTNPGDMRPACCMRTTTRGRSVVCRSSLYVRPYTVRSGDTLFSICRKRGFELSEVMALNHGLDPEFILEGQTILLPSGSLSSRDKDILRGIGPRSYRTYPVRSGEVIEDIIKPRKIFMEEVEALNPGVDLNSLQEGQVIKLPPGKYTVREREMLAGTAGAPDAFFSSAPPIMLAGLVGATLGAAGAYWYITKFGDPLTSDDETA